MNKECSKCEKPLLKSNRSGLCKKHFRGSPEYKEKMKLIAKRYISSDKGQITRAVYKRKWGLKKRFGISVDDYNELFLKQNGSCAICGCSQKGLKKRLAVDHNHETGIIRGLLCKSCNIALGEFKDSVEILDKAMAYLKE